MMYLSYQSGTSILHRISKLNSPSNCNPIIHHFGVPKLIQDNIPPFKLITTQKISL